MGEQGLDSLTLIKLRQKLQVASAAAAMSCMPCTDLLSPGGPPKVMQKPCKAKP